MGVAGFPKPNLNFSKYTVLVAVYKTQAVSRGMTVDSGGMLGPPGALGFGDEHRAQRSSVRDAGTETDTLKFCLGFLFHICILVFSWLSVSLAVVSSQL